MTNNINIKLPSGDIKSYPEKITPSEIAAEISISLKKNAIISKVCLLYTSPSPRDTG